MKKSIQHIIIILTLLVTGLQVTAQTFPVQVIPQVTPPPPVYLSDYANASNSIDRIRASVLLTDLTVANRQVRLKLYIEGNGINAQSRDFVVGAQPLFLDGGVPVQLGAIDLAPYFELQNLQGISAGAYANTLPEGLYQFCFEVYDVISGNIISKKSCTNVLIFLNEPPFLNLPQNNINLEASNPQNILFQWTPRHINVTNVEYEFSLVEIWDFNMDPQAVFLASPPIYQTTTQATSFLYGAIEPQLLEGKRYAWRVRAKALDGIDEIGLFSNNGYSEIFAFTYQGECAEPVSLSVEEVGTKTATFRWQGDIDNLNYRIGYRKAMDDDGNTGEANTFQWFENDTNREEYMVIDLEPDTMYEWRVGGYCVDGTLTYAPTTTFTTMNEDAEAYYNCGIEPSIDIANQVLLETIQVGDVIKAGDFNVKIQEVSGSNSFSGKGYTTVGFLRNIKIALVFTNIQVNTSYQFVSGEIKTVYDPTWSNILDVDDVIDEFEDLVDVVLGDDQVEITVDFDITEDDINVDTDSGQIIITDPETGETSTHDYDSGDTYTITDASGDEYSIDADGNVTQTGTGAEGGPATAENTNGITNGYNHNVGSPSVREIDGKGIFITYSKTPNTKYELDNANNDYEKANYHKVTVNGGADYYPPHKAVADGESDMFYADITNSNTTINLDSLIFKTVAGKKIEASKDGNRYTITVNANNHYKNEEAIITYKDSTGMQHVLSSFFIHHIKKQPEIKVQVVLVNGAQDITNLQTRLNEIFTPAAGNFRVVGASQTIDIPEAAWDVDEDNGQIDYNGSGIASDYPKELRAIKDYYKQEFNDFDSKTYHIFVLDDSMPATKALQGFMPKTRQWGFLFEAHLQSENAIEQKQDIATVAVHELGHGVYSLGHPFGDNPDNSGQADTWLMDYKNGIELAYPNWAKMSDKGLKLGLFQDDEDNEFGASQYLVGFNVVPDNFSQYTSSTTQSYSFVSSAGKIISIPTSVSDVTFKSNGALFGFTIIENGKKERYLGARQGNKFKGYLKNLNKNTPWDQKVYKDNYSRNLPNNVVVYSGKLNKTSEDCGIDLYKGSFKNEADKNEWNSGGNGIVISSTYNAFAAISNPTNINPNNELIDSPEACRSCDEGDKFIASYSAISDQSIKEQIDLIAYLICDPEADPSFFDEFSKDGYNKLLAWQKTFYDNGEWKNDLDAFTGFYEAYSDYITYYKDAKVIINNSNDREALLRIAYNFGDAQLKSLTAQEKLKMLKILSSGAMTGYWTSTNYNIEALALRIINSVNNKFENNQISTFLDGLYNEIYNVDEKPLYVNLFNKIDDFFGDPNFTTLTLKLTELVKMDKGLNPDTVPTQSFIAENAVERFTWDVKNESFLWIFNKVKDNSKILVDKTKQSVINLKQGCTKLQQQGSGQYVSYICTEWAIDKNIKPFDLVSLIIINDITFTKASGACNNSTAIICGQETLVPAAFLIFLDTKKENTVTKNIATNTLTAASIYFSGASVVAARGAIAVAWPAYIDLFVTFTDPYFSSNSFKNHAASALINVFNTDEQIANELATGLQIGWTVGSTALTLNTAKDIPNPQKHIEALATYKALVKKVGESKARNILAADAQKADKAIDGFKKIEENIIKEGGENQLLDEILKVEKKIDDIAHNSWITSIGRRVDDLSEAPMGYEFYTRFGNKWLRRVDASNTNTPRLTVKEGKVVKYDGQTITNLSESQVNDLAFSATQNKNAEMVMLGKHNKDISQTSYNREAGKTFSFFEMNNWDDIFKLVNESKSEIWKVNERFIKNQFNANKPFYFSHNPNDINIVETSSFYDQELLLIRELIQQKYNKAAKFNKAGKYWKLEW